LNLLTNDEVLESTRTRGRASTPWRKSYSDVWAKKMEDGSLADGLFNRNESPQTVTARLADLHVQGKVRVRDLWRQKDLGVRRLFGAEIPRHGRRPRALFPAD